MMAAERMPVQVDCRVLGVSESGHYQHRKRTPSERSIRHAMLTELINQVHDESTGSTAAAEAIHGTAGVREARRHDVRHRAAMCDGAPGPRECLTAR